jgi:hypothetical protein
MPPRRIERGGALAALTACTARVDLNGRILNFRRNEPSAEEAQKMEARGSSESIISIFPTHYIDITIRNSGCFHNEPPDVFTTREFEAFLEPEFRRHENGHRDPTNSNKIAYLLNILSQRGTNVCVP